MPEVEICEKRAELQTNWVLDSHVYNCVSCVGRKFFNDWFIFVLRFCNGKHLSKVVVALS